MGPCGVGEEGDGYLTWGLYEVALDWQMRFEHRKGSHRGAHKPPHWQ